MKSLSDTELSTSDIIIPFCIWEKLPKNITDLLYGYIGIPVSNGKLTGYKFKNVPSYLQQQLMEAYTQWQLTIKI